MGRLAWQHFVLICSIVSYNVIPAMKCFRQGKMKRLQGLNGLHLIGKQLKLQRRTHDALHIHQIGQPQGSAV
jgi:hypothetical protein